MKLHTRIFSTFAFVVLINSPIARASDLPQVNFTTLEGNPITLENISGEVGLINFWATWCPPCVREMPALGRLESMVSGDARVIAINVGDPADAVEAFILENFEGAEPEIWLDEPGNAFTKFKLAALPMTWVVDAKGNVIDKIIGEREWDDPEIANYLRELSKH